MVAGDELPLAAEPGARPLLTLLRCALQPGALDEETAAELLTGPLGGTDAVGLRRLRRSLHAVEAAAGLPGTDRPLGTVLRDPRVLGMLDGPAVAAARRVAGLLDLARRTATGTVGHGTAQSHPGTAGDGPPSAVTTAGKPGNAGDGAPSPAAAAGRPGTAGDGPPSAVTTAGKPGNAGDGAPSPAAAAGRPGTAGDGPPSAAAVSPAAALGQPGSAYEVLWAVWDASGLGAAWQAASAAGGSAGEAADRDLDAVVALFDAAARFEARLPPGSPALFLDSMSGQEIPGDSLADQAPDGDAVRILTAHRSKGLEWDVVVVAGVQEGTWPDLRARSSLLSMDELVTRPARPLTRRLRPAGRRAGRTPPRPRSPPNCSAEERRLFYVAVTRARRGAGRHRGRG